MHRHKCYITQFNIYVTLYGLNFARWANTQYFVSYYQLCDNHALVELVQHVQLDNVKLISANKVRNCSDNGPVADIWNKTKIGII